MNIRDKNIYKFSHINIGYGEDITIRELVDIICNIIGYTGNRVYDNNLNGVPRKLMDSSLANSLGWKPSTPLKEGLIKTCNEYINNTSL